MTDLAQDIVGYVGEDITVVDTISGSGNLTGTFEGYIRSEESGSLVKTLTTSDITIQSAVLRKITFSLLEAFTSTLRPGLYSYSVWDADSGEKTPLSIGTFTITETSKYGPN